MITSNRLEKADVGLAIRRLARPAPAPVSVQEPQAIAPAPIPTASNSTLTHLDAAISNLEKEVEIDKQDLARLEDLQRGIAKKQELLAALTKERGKFVGQE